MEPTSEIQYKVDQPRQWQVGDLIRSSEIQFLIISEKLDYIRNDGQTWYFQYGGDDKDFQFSHSTGLVYTYQNREQVQRDYKAGLFIPYFEIL